MFPAAPVSSLTDGLSPSVLPPTPDPLQFLAAETDCARSVRMAWDDCFDAPSFLVRTGARFFFLSFSFFRQGFSAETMSLASKRNLARKKARVPLRRALGSVSPPVYRSVRLPFGA